MVLKGGLKASRRVSRNRDSLLQQTKGFYMLKWAAIFLVVALVAAVLGFAGIAGAAAGIAKLLFFVFLAVFLIMLVMGLFAGSKI